MRLSKKGESELGLRIAALLILFGALYGLGLLDGMFSTIGLTEQYKLVIDEFYVQPGVVSLCQDVNANCPSEYCDDGNYKIQARGQIRRTCGGLLLHDVARDSLMLIGRGDVVDFHPVLTTKQDFTNKDIKIRLTADVAGEYYYFNIIGGSTNILSYTFGEGTRIIEVLTSPVDSNFHEVFVNGDFLRSFTTSSPLSFSFQAGGSPDEARLLIDYIRVKPVFGCEVNPGEFLAYEPFGGNQDISLYSLRYPVVRLCDDEPPVVFKEGSGATKSIEILNKMANGEVQHIPSDESWGIFYVMKNDGSLPVINTCKATDVYNTKTNTCQDPSGLVTLCSQGQFDPAMGACVIQPEVRTICSQGRYDTSQNICIYNPPTQAVCLDSTAIYSSVSGKCEITAPSTHTCPSGYSYNVGTDKCESFPSATIVCDAPYAYDATTKTCIWKPESAVECSGNYDVVTKICSKELPAQNTCPSGTTLISRQDGTYMCISSPDTENVCLVGKYSTTTKKCEVTPDYQYLCLNGRISSDKKSCEIDVGKVDIKCPEEYTYKVDVDKCVSKPKGLSENGKSTTIWWILGIISFGGLYHYYARKK